MNIWIEDGSYMEPDPKSFRFLQCDHSLLKAPWYGSVA